jgi:glycosyltransferase involved in cell wall biosynthesis
MKAFPNIETTSDLPETTMTRILFLIRSLERGGAERQLIELLKGLDKTRFDVTLATFYSGGALRSETEVIPGIKVVSLAKGGRWDVGPFLFRLIRLARASRPHIIHGYLDVPNLLAVLAGGVAGAKIVWGMRASNMDLSHYDWLSRLAFRLQCMAGRLADLIIANSTAGKIHGEACGLPSDRLVVIPNGIDTERFQPSFEAGLPLRRKWGSPGEGALIGLVARLDPTKDHQNFLRAASLVAAEHPTARFVCVGDGPSEYQRELEALGATLALSERLKWVGPRDDMRAVYNALDVAVLASSSEGFPNVVGEAMACGVPCVVTDVGDAAWVVGESGVVVPPSEPEQLANGITRMLARPDERAALGASARERIIRHFSTDALITTTSQAFGALIR